MGDKLYYVYYLYTSEDELIYIGKGSGNRMYKHSTIAMGSSINRTKNPKLYNKIKQIIDNGGFIMPKIVFQSYDEIDCLNEEVKLIDKVGLDKLCNLTSGGEGTSGYKLSEETRIKMSKAKKQQWKDGRLITNEHKEKLLQNPQLFKNGHKGYWKDKNLSEETKLKMSKSKKGKKTGPISEKRRLAIINGIKNKKKNKIEFRVHSSYLFVTIKFEFRIICYKLK